MRMISGPNGYVKEIRNENGKLLTEVVVNGILFRRNTIYKTYNSVVNNQLLNETH